MFDTMTMTKIVGGFCGAFLVFLIGNWAAEEIYHVGSESSHGEVVQAYTIEVPESGTDVSAEEVVGPTYAEVAEIADASAGEGEFRACQACHALEQGVNGVGPSLYGVVGRAVASIDGYSYSGALASQADVWSGENLFAFLEDPSGWAPGTAMSYRGMRDAEDRANLIAYLETFGG